MEIALGAATSARVPPGATMLIPVGSTEAHGPYLPLDTDTEIATAAAELAAKMLRRRRLNVVVAPALAYGVSTSRADQPGSASVDADLLQSTLVALVHSASAWAGRFVIVDAGHSNSAAVDSAVARLATDRLDVTAVSCGDGTSNPVTRATEASLMLHLRPWNVRLPRAGRPSNGRPRLVHAGPIHAAVAPTEVPAEDVLCADADDGREALDLLAWRVTRSILD